MFEPPLDAVENIRLMASQAKVIAVDDGSPRRHETLLRSVERLAGVTLVRLPTNVGIAAAMNVGIRHSIRDGANMVVTFDQDSTPRPDHVKRVCEVIVNLGDIDCVVAGPGLVGGELLSPDVANAPGPIPVTSLYQSGMGLPVGTLLRIGFFDESLFIDGVDTEYCMRVKRFGGAVFALPDLELPHRLGVGHQNFRRVRVGHFTPVATFHSAERRYYMNRNLVCLIRRYWRDEPHWAIVSIRRTMGSNILSWTVEDDRMRKFVASVRGIAHGLLGRGGPMNR